MKLFQRTKLNSKGFSHVELSLLIVLVVAIVGVGYYVYRDQKTTPPVAHAGSDPLLVFSESGGTGASQSSLYISDGSGATLLSTQSNSYGKPEWVNNASSIDYTNGGEGLYSVNSGGTSPTEIVPSAQAFDWSQATDKLAYAVNGSNAIYTSNSDGSGVENIYTTSSNQPLFGGAIWSPNGKDMFFRTFNDNTQNGYTFVISKGGSLVGKLPKNSLPVGWTSDSSKLVLGVTSSKDLNTIKTNGTGLTEIPNTSGYGFAAVSPDNEIAYGIYNYKGPKYNCSIYIVGLNGSGKKLVYTGPNNMSCYQMDWSPDGSRLAFSLEGVDNNTTAPGYALYTIKVDGSGLSRVYTSSAGSLDGLDWSIQ